MPVCDGVPSLQWFLLPSLDSCSLESCRLQSCCPETRRVLCEQHSSAHSCQNHSLGACGTTVEMNGSQVCREIIPGCSSRLADVRLIFFLGCCETALSVRLISELLACPVHVLLLLEPCSRSQAGFQGCLSVLCRAAVLDELFLSSKLGMISAGQCWNALCPRGAVDCGPLGCSVCSDLVSCSSGDVQYLDVAWLWSPLWPLNSLATPRHELVLQLCSPVLGCETIF